MAVTGPSRYRPTPWNESCNFWYWNQDKELTTPRKCGFTYTKAKSTQTGRPRIDLSADRAWENRRFWGYIASVEEGKSENTETPFQLTLVGRIWFVEDDDDEPSWHYVRIVTWTSNCLVTTPTAFLLGDLVTGLFAASYGGHMTAGLDTWKPTNSVEWDALAPYDLPNPLLEIDLNWWAIEGLPDLGGSAFHYAGEPEITGFRIAPPPLDPHKFHQERKAKKKVTVQDPNGDPPVEEKENEKRPTSRRRDDHSKSAARYDGLRKDIGEEPTSRGQHRSDHRGRSRVPHYLR